MYWHPQIKRKPKSTQTTQHQPLLQMYCHPEEAQNYTNDSESESRIEQTVSPEMQGITN